MSLFVCDECGFVENTATSRYWLRNCSARELGHNAVPLEGRALCSACDPAIGEWHGLFRREYWDGQRPVINR